MADVACSGTELIAEMQASQTTAQEGLFWWLGQHSLAMKLGPTMIYIDPYLEPNPARQTPPLFAPEEITNADLVLCTHDHLDHIDPFALQGIVAASPHAIFVAPRPHRQRMLEIGVPEARLRLLNAEEQLTVCGLTVTAIKAKHEFFDEQPEGFPHLGYVIEGYGVCAYHSGDTLVYEGLLTALQKWRFDAMFLPINGRDARRYRMNCIGNMTYQEAVDLAGELEAGLAVPTHWDMFAHNAEDPALFVDYLKAKYPQVRSWVGPAGKRVPFGRNYGA